MSLRTRLPIGTFGFAEDAPPQAGADPGPSKPRDLFPTDGLPDPAQLGADRRALPRVPAKPANADVPVGLPTPKEPFMAPANKPRIEPSPARRTVAKKDDWEGGMGSRYAVPEYGTERSYRIELPKKLYSLDYLLALLFAVGGFALVIKTYQGIGMAWDEGYYYRPASKTLAWLRLFQDPEKKPFREFEIDEAFYSDFKDIPELPMVPKFVLAFGLWLGERYNISPPYVAMRYPVAACYGLSLLILYLLAGKYYGRAGAILTVVCYMAIPRVFGHAHIAGTETILIFLCLLLTYSFVRGLDHWTWSVVTGIVFGLCLATKVNAVFFPVTLVLWAQVFQRRFYVTNLFCLLFLGPLVMVAVWPPLWPDPVARVLEYLRYFALHKQIEVQFFGKIFPIATPGGELILAPWSYPFLIAVFITPAVVLALAFLGLARTLANLRSHDIGVLYLLQFLAPMALVALPLSPKYDGERLFATAFPFVALLAGIGGQGIVSSIRGYGSSPARRRGSQIFAVLLTLSLAGYGAWNIYKIHPHELAYWNEILGGVRGAETSQMETTYWAEAANEDVYAYLNALPEGTRVRPLALHDLTFELLQKWGVIPAHLKISPKPPCDVILLQARQGFFKAEESGLFDARQQYGETLVSCEGVPLIIAYDLSKHRDLAAALEGVWARKAAAEAAASAPASAPASSPAPVAPPPASQSTPSAPPGGSRAPSAPLER